MAKWSRWIVLWLLLESPSAFAGQLHYSYLELRDVPAHAGYVVAVLVAFVDAQRRNVRIKARINQRWGSVPDELKGKNELEVTLNPGVEWNDPHVSPIEHRVRGFLSQVKPNTEVLLVPLGGIYEALPYDVAMKRKLDVFFAATGIADYQKSASVKDLVHDLQDEDLSQLAYDALQTRKLLRPEHLLDLEPYRMRQLAWHHLTHAAAEQRTEFLRTATKRFAGKPFDDRMGQLLRLLYEVKLEPSDLPPLAELLNAMDLRSEQANGDFILLKDKLVERFKAPDAKPSAGLFVPAMVRFAIHRPGYRSDDPGTAVFLAGLERPSRIRMARELIAASYKGQRFDYWLFETAMPVAIETASRDYLPELAALDLTLISGTNWQVTALVMCLKVALRILETDPAALPAVRKAIDPLCAHQSVNTLLNLTSPEGKALLERYRKLVLK